MKSKIQDDGGGGQCDLSFPRETLRVGTNRALLASSHKQVIGLL